MPNYGAASPIGLFPGQQYALFAAETPTAPQSSQAVAVARPQSIGYDPVVFEIFFASAPTDSLVIQGAMADVDARYQTLYTSTNTQQDVYSDLGGFAFYRARLVSQSGGGAVTVTVRH